MQIKIYNDKIRKIIMNFISKFLRKIKIPMNKKDGKESEKESRAFLIPIPINNMLRTSLYGSELETIEEG